jgi:FAD/FMN-containing dehydrogenase
MNSVLNELEQALPAGRVVPPEAIAERHRGDWGVEMALDETPLAVVYPADAVEVARVATICSARACPVVAQGGLTGLAGAATPVAGGVIVSLERMRGIEEIDPAAATMTVGAGTPLESVQNAAAEAGFFFPLDLGARGSCQIGGNLATNAGGNRVLRYGMARDLVLGLEVVLADGTIVTTLNKMQKNNAGYDVKQWFIGSEGTLGIITRAVLRLFPATGSVCTALCAVPDYASAVSLLQHVKTGLGPTLSAFEVMWPDFYQLAAETCGRAPPLPYGHAAYILLDTLGMEQASDQARFESVIAGALDKGLIADAVTASSLQGGADLWALRDLPGEFGRVFSPQANFDVSIAIGDIGAFVERCRQALAERWPAARVIFFGHIADSNVHLSFHMEQLPVEEVEAAVYAVVREFGGSISAEHGIGLLKKPFLDYSRSTAEIDLMKRIKAALDPAGILNPGKVFD